MTVTAYVFLNIKKDEGVDFIKKIKTKSGVIDINELYGKYDLMIKIQKNDVEDLQNFISKEIRKFDEINQSTTVVSRNGL